MILSQNNVISTFISFHHTTRQDYNEDERIIIGCPSQEQIALVITSLQLQRVIVSPQITQNTAM